MTHRSKFLVALLASCFVGVTINLAATLYVSVYWWPQDLMTALGWALVRSLPLLVPLALALLWRPVGRHQWAILFAATIGMIAVAVWLYVDVIVIQEDRKSFFLLAGVHLYQWQVAAVGLLLYAAVYGVGRLRRTLASERKASTDKNGTTRPPSVERTTQT
jgi:hypothetical protein